MPTRRNVVVIDSSDDDESQGVTRKKKKDIVLFALFVSRVKNANSLFMVAHYFSFLRAD